jgi:hypothetical protein
MDELQEQIIIGSLLGDGGLYKPKGKNTNAYFYERHGLGQVEYARYKADKLSSLCKSGLKIRSYYCEFQTRSLPLFTDLYNAWYPNGEKIVSDKYLERLGAVGLAVWFGDDGSSTLPSQREIATMCFSLRDHKKLQNVLLCNFGLDSDIRRNCNNKPFLVITKNSMRKFVDIISPYLHSSMRYKISKVSKRQRFFTEQQMLDIRDKYASGDYTQRELAVLYGVCCATICKTINGSYSQRDPLEWI